MNARFARTLCVALFLIQPGGCGPSAASHGASARRAGPALEYAIPTVSGSPIETPAHRGRVTVLLFITTFDVFSQSQAARLEDFYRSHQPRINAAAVVMEPPKNLELVVAFSKVLDLSYSVGMADHRELERQGLLAAVNSVPAWLIMNASGELVASGVGTLTIAQLELAVTEAER